ncbi:MAG: 2OG-Fe(II) oxygenase [Campylobacterales bacterium]|nr:2OG-Fe(II) oxygenase [Campylobacterales bacterium]
MHQISTHVYCDEAIASLPMQSRLTASPYHDFPYLLIEGFLDQTEAASIAYSTLNSNEHVSAHVRTQKQGVLDTDLLPDIRKTVIHALSDIHQQLYFDRFSLYQKQIEDFFAVALGTASNIQALGYHTGDFYVKHADDSSELIDSNGRCIGFKQVASNRKITTVLFASSYNDPPRELNQFSGGELCFNYLFDAKGAMLKLRPQAGDMIIFPSNPIFSHEVLPVQAGYRLTLVQWHNVHIA